MGPDNTPVVDFTCVEPGLQNEGLRTQEITDWGIGSATPGLNSNCLSSPQVALEIALWMSGSERAAQKHIRCRHCYAWPHQGRPSFESTGGSPCEVGLPEDRLSCIVQS